MIEVSFKHLYKPGDTVFIVSCNRIYVRTIYSVRINYRFEYKMECGELCSPSSQATLSYVLFEPREEKPDKERAYREEELYPSIDDAYAAVKSIAESQYLELKNYLEGNMGAEGSFKQ